MSVLEAGQRIGSFELIDQIGSTLMGEVWRAWDSAGQLVAVKTIGSQIRKDAEFIARFEREAQEQSRLIHSSIIPIYDFFSEDGNLFLVMPFIAGGSLEQLLEREQRLPIETALDIAIQVLSALDYAHRNLVIHRDVKPSNILLDGNHAYLADFGIALVWGKNRLTTGLRAVGTVEYMSPEQIRDPAEIKHLSDVYGLGCVLYEMLSGRPPFVSEGRGTDASYEVQSKHLNEEPAPVRKWNDAVPERLERIVMTALAKDPADRFHGCGSFAKALESVLRDLREDPAHPIDLASATPDIPPNNRPKGVSLPLNLGAALLLIWFVQFKVLVAQVKLDLAILIALAIQTRLLFLAWKAIGLVEPGAKSGIRPRQAIGRLFIPVYHIFWGWRVYVGFARKFNSLVARRARQPVGLYVIFWLLNCLALPAIFIAFQILLMSRSWLDFRFLFPMQLGLIWADLSIILTVLLCIAINGLSKGTVLQR